MGPEVAAKPSAIATPLGPKDSIALLKKKKYNKLKILASMRSPTLRIKSSSSNFRVSASLAILFYGSRKVSKRQFSSNENKNKNNKSNNLLLINYHWSQKLKLIENGEFKLNHYSNIPLRVGLYSGKKKIICNMLHITFS